MNYNNQKVINILKESGALLKGHFILRSGMHSSHYLQCAQIGQYLDKISILAKMLLQNITVQYKTVLSLAMGSLVIGQEIARQDNKRYIFLEKKNDQLVLRRGLKIIENEKILIIEDVVTKGGRVNEALEIIKKNQGNPIGIASLIDRSQKKIKFPIPFFSLVRLNFPIYHSNELPFSLRNIPPIKHGS